MRTHKVSLKILLFLIFIVFANTELLSGSTTVFTIFNPLNFSGLAFYGFLFLIYIDLADMYKFDAIQIFVLGMMHGILEEGIALWTFFYGHPEASPLPLPGDLPGLRLTWILQTVVGEAFMVVVIGILFARVFIPYAERRRPLLSAKTTWILGAVVILESVLYMVIIYVLRKSVPSLLPLTITWLLIIDLGLFLAVYQLYVKQKIHQMIKKGKKGDLGYLILSILVMIGYTFAMLGMEKNPSSLNKVLITFLFTGIPGSFLVFRAWSDKMMTKKKLTIVFSVFLLSFTILFTFVRPVISTPVVFFITFIQIFLLIRKVRIKV